MQSPFNSQQLEIMEEPPVDSLIGLNLARGKVEQKALRSGIP